MRVSFVAMWLVSVIVLVLSAHYHKSYQLDLHLKEQARLLGEHYQASVYHFEEKADMVYNRHVLRPEVLDQMWVALNADETLRNDIRSKIYQFLSKPYKALTHVGVKQFHFHLPGAVSFLRMHRPSKYGDNLSTIRYSLVKTNETKVKTVGFEEGRVYNGFRYVYPLFIGKAFVGTVEVGMSSERIINIMDNLFKGQHYFFISKAVVDRKVFADERSNYETSFLTGYYKEGDSQLSMGMKIPDGTVSRLVARMKEQVNERIKDKGMFSVYTKLDDTVYLGSFFPVKNVKGEKVAYIAKCQPDSRIPEIFLFHQMMIIVGTVVIMLAWILIYVVLK